MAVIVRGSNGQVSNHELVFPKEYVTDDGFRAKDFWLKKGTVIHVDGSRIAEDGELPIGNVGGTSQLGGWERLENLPQQLSKKNAVIYKSAIYAVGEFVMNFDGEKWEGITSAPTKYVSGLSAADDTYLYILCCGYNSSRDCYRFNGKEWTYFSSTPYSVNNSGATVYNGKIYITGDTTGWTGCYVYDGEVWSNKSTPFNSKGGPAFVYKNEMYVFGCGVCYKLNEETWIKVMDIPAENSYGCIAFVFNDEFYFIYGSNFYKWNKETWDRLETLPYNTLFGSGVVYRNKVYLVGGYIGNPDTTDKEIAPLRFYQSMEDIVPEKISYAMINDGKLSVIKAEKPLCVDAKEKVLYIDLEETEEGIYGYFKQGMTINGLQITKDGYATLKTEFPLEIKGGK